MAVLGAGFASTYRRQRLKSIHERCSEMTDLSGRWSKWAHGYGLTAVVAVVVIVLRLWLHEVTPISETLASEMPQAAWARWLGGHDWLLHGFDEGEWLTLVHAYMGGAESPISRPPLFPMVSAAVASVVGHRVFSMHLVNHIVGWLICVMSFTLGRRLAGPVVGVGAALLMAVSARALSLESQIGAFPLLLLSLILLAVTGLSVLRRQSLARGIGLGVAATMALTAHYTSVPFVLPMLLIVAMLGGRKTLRPLRAALGAMVVLSVLIFATIPAKRVHSGGTSLADFYAHALSHPDGRNSSSMLDFGEIDKGKDVSSAIRRIIRQGPVPALNSMSVGYGPDGFQAVVVVLILVGLLWPGVATKRWHAPVVLLLFTGPLLLAAPALIGEPDHRYLAFAMPFSAIAFCRGAQQLSTLMARHVAASLRAAMALSPLAVVLVSMADVATNHEDFTVHSGLEHHELAKQIRVRFGSGGYIIGPTGGVGPISAYGALTRRIPCELGSRDGSCLDGRSQRADLAACAKALLARCHDGADTPYVLDLGLSSQVRDPNTVALHRTLAERAERLETPMGNRVKVFVLEADVLRSLAAAAP
jgi:hypothetical protein